MVTSVDEALAGANRVGYPVLLRPSYVLGGRAMVIAYDDEAVLRYMGTAIEYSQERPVLIEFMARVPEEATLSNASLLQNGRYPEDGPVQQAVRPDVPPPEALPPLDAVIARSMPGLGVGLHLVLVEGRPVLPASPMPYRPPSVSTRIRQLPAAVAGCIPSALIAVIFNLPALTLHSKVMAWKRIKPPSICKSSAL